jgi:sulfur carrier protein
MSTEVSEIERDGDRPGPAEILVNGATHPLGAISTVADLVAELGWSGRACAVELNRRVVPRREHERTPIAAGDRLEIVTLVGGG